MKLFSKIAFIFNISFVVFILLAYIEFNHKNSRTGDNILPLPFFTGLFVILGELAIFVNFVFCLVVLALLLSKKIQTTLQWVVIVNFIFLLIQLYYFFI